MSVTELDDLKAAWQTLSRNLERQHTLAVRQFKETRLMRFRSGLRPLVLGQLLQFLIGIVITVFSAQYWVAHRGVWPLLICGLFLQAYGIMFIAFAVRDLVLIRQIDYAAPVVEIQKQLEELRAWHLRTALWHGLAGSLVWLPVMILLLQGLGTDVSWLGQPNKLLWLVSSALVCLGLNFGLVRLARSPGKCGRALRNTWIGSTVNRAQTALDEIEQFEKE